MYALLDHTNQVLSLHETMQAADTRFNEACDEAAARGEMGGYIVAGPLLAPATVGDVIDVQAIIRANQAASDEWKRQAEENAKNIPDDLKDLFE